MCIVLDQLAEESNVIEMHGTNNTVKFDSHGSGQGRMAGCLGQLHQPDSPSRAERLVDGDSMLWIGLLLLLLLLLVVVVVVLLLLLKIIIVIIKIHNRKSVLLRSAWISLSI